MNNRIVAGGIAALLAVGCGGSNQPTPAGVLDPNDKPCPGPLKESDSCTSKPPECP